MESRHGLLRNVLSREVPALPASTRAGCSREGLEQHDLEHRDIGAWIWHAGGRTVLERLRAATGLEEHDMRRSAELLARFGNLSSPFVLFVLAAALAERERSGCWWMSSFGAGFSCHGAFLNDEDSVIVMRIIETEWLDSLPASDPRAERSRRDLRRVNTIMGNARHIAAALRPHWREGMRVADLGAGDGS